MEIAITEIAIKARPNAYIRLLLMLWLETMTYICFTFLRPSIQLHCQTLGHNICLRLSNDFPGRFIDTFQKRSTTRLGKNYFLNSFLFFSFSLRSNGILYWKVSWIACQGRFNLSHHKKWFSLLFTILIFSTKRKILYRINLHREFSLFKRQAVC